LKASQIASRVFSRAQTAASPDAFSLSAVIDRLSSTGDLIRTSFQRSGLGSTMFALPNQLPSSVDASPPCASVLPIHIIELRGRMSALNNSHVDADASP
jgi:hypothetical protein